MTSASGVTSSRDLFQNGSSTSAQTPNTINVTSTGTSGVPHVTTPPAHPTINNTAFNPSTSVIFTTTSSISTRSPQLYPNTRLLSAGEKDSKRASIKQQIAEYEEELLGMMNDLYSYYDQQLQQPLQNLVETPTDASGNGREDGVMRIPGRDPYEDNAKPGTNYRRNMIPHGSLQNRRSMRLGVPASGTRGLKRIATGNEQMKLKLAQTQVERTPAELEGELLERNINRYGGENLKPSSRGSSDRFVTRKKARPKFNSDLESGEAGERRRWSIRKTTPARLFRDPDFERARVRLDRQRKVGRLLGSHQTRDDVMEGRHNHRL